MRAAEAEQVADYRFRFTTGAGARERFGDEAFALRGVIDLFGDQCGVC
jgi:hypothetical protein